MRSPSVLCCRTLWRIALVCGVALGLLAGALLNTLPGARADDPSPDGAYGGLDDYFIKNGLTGGYNSPRPAPGLPRVRPQGSTASYSHTVYLPFVGGGSEPALHETRALWVSRFDLSQNPPATPASILAIVQKASYAHLNTIIFQVRGQADALYTPGLEPWSSSLTGNLGQNPGWDPLATLIECAHSYGIEVHAWLNAYPAWRGTRDQSTWPSDSVSPRPMLNQFNQLYGSDWLQWTASGPMQFPPAGSAYPDYVCGSPANPYVAQRIVDVSKDLLTRYDLDGLHFDYIRYVDKPDSYDPVSNAAYGHAQASDPYLSRAQWQRDQVTHLLQRIAGEAMPLRPGARLTTTAWPIYRDYWNYFNGYDGYSCRYQDSQGWGASRTVAAIMPMMYGPSFTNYRDRYQTIVPDFVSGAQPGGVVVGIAGDYSSFDEIDWRIAKAREAGAWGQVLFSYYAVDYRNWWQALRDGPYKELAVPNWP